MPPELVIEAAAQKVIGEGLHQLIQADVVPTLARPFGISGVSHSSHRDTETQRKTRKINGNAFFPNLLCGSVAKPLSQRWAYTVRGHAHSTAKEEEFLEMNFILRRGCG